MGLGVDMTLASFIKTILPKLSESEAQLTLQTLENLGFESIEDLVHLKETDLAGILKACYIRKLIAQVPHSESSALPSPVSQATDGESMFSCGRFQMERTEETIDNAGRSQMARTEQRAAVASKTCGRKERVQLNADGASEMGRTDGGNTSPVPNDWYLSFEVPWMKLPTTLLRILEKSGRPSPKIRREMVRLVVEEVLTVCPNPSTKHLTEIARKIVSRHPASFKDVIEGQVVGSGFDSLTKQLRSRVENVNRSSIPFKRQNETSTSSPPKKTSRSDAYGCINWAPSQLPMSETDERQNEQKKQLQQFYDEGCRNETLISKKMKTTYFTQRKDVNNGKDISWLQKEWPYLFQVLGAKMHFRELTGIELNEEFTVSLENKSRRVKAYMEASSTTDKFKILSDIENAKKELKSENPDKPGMILLLLAHFSEKEQQLFFPALDTYTSQDVETTALPATPCIVFCGSSPLNATRYMVAIDQTVVNEDISDFEDALVLFFTAFYNFNLQYPAELASTLEFIQRCIFRINPDRGSKVKRQDKKRQNAVNPKVLSLISNIAHYEWHS